MKIKKKILYLIIGLIFMALSGLMLLQIYFIRNAYEQKEQAFRSNVTAALNNVTNILETNEAARSFVETAINDSIPGIKRISPDFPLPRPGAKNITSAYVTNDCDVLSEVNAYKFAQDRDHVVNVVVRVSDTTKKNSDISLKKNSLIQRKKRTTTISTTTSSIFPDGKKGSTFYFYFSGNGNKQESIAVSNLSKKSKNNIVNKVVDKLIFTEHRPINKRVNVKEVDSLLAKSFSESGISLKYGFGVLTGDYDSLAVSFNNNNISELKSSPLKARLFPSDLLSPQNFLVVNFPDSKMMILKEMAPILALSLIFILIIGGSFVYTIRTIINQKRFASHIINFINNMTHEFKTPISTISLASEAISNPAIVSDTQKLTRYNQIIKEENNRMRNQVEKILQMAVIEDKDYELDLQIIDLNSVITRAVHNHSLTIDAAGGNIKSSLEAVNHLIAGDLVHISNIINNILDNAVKYSLETPDINITTKNISEKIEICVTDKGIGIREDDIKKIFDKYFRVSTGNTHDIKGFGLGLSYVKLMVEAHRGSISVKSKPGSGTTVSILFPINGY